MQFDFTSGSNKRITPQPFPDSIHSIAEIDELIGLLRSAREHLKVKSLARLREDD